MLIAGVDEAGRGPVLGSMIIACITCTEDEIAELERLGVRDSKKLTPARREQIFEALSSYRWKIEEVTPEEIDRRFEAGKSLNAIQIEAVRRLLAAMKPDVAYIDSIGRSRCRSLSAHCRVIVESRADERYPVVSAASIIAKVLRDRKLEELRREYGDFGSGYPSDPKTLAFLKSHYPQLPHFVRRSWSTVRRLAQQKLTSLPQTQYPQP
ncbi:MAG: ribonuclease HII [Euryarchaeota archaeon]|nr:ribonuclease HII [Euryarchaeota archaeon]